MNKLNDLLQNSSSFENYKMVEDFYTLHVLFGKVQLIDYFKTNNK